MVSEVRKQIDAKMSSSSKPSDMTPRPMLSPTPAERYAAQMEAMHEAMESMMEKKSEKDSDD